MITEHQKSLFAILAAIIISIVFLMPSEPGKTAEAKNQEENSQKTAGNQEDNEKDSIDLKLMEKGLVNLADLQAGFVIDLKYGTSDNFTGSPLYKSPRCYLKKSTAEKLVLANREFIKKGYRIKIFDAYRPLSVQWVLWDKVKIRYKAYIANPHTGSRHNRGVAVDVTLVDSNGQEIEMPTGFDQFGRKCHSDYSGCSPEAANNRAMLAKVMVKYGFQREDCEWWHFDDVSKLNSPLLNINI